jgi:uncharacterized membrane protein YidH (DUF202 family)
MQPTATAVRINNMARKREMPHAELVSIAVSPKMEAVVPFHSPFSRMKTVTTLNPPKVWGSTSFILAVIISTLLPLFLYKRKLTL